MKNAQDTEIGKRYYWSSTPTMLRAHQRYRKLLYVLGALLLIVIIGPAAYPILDLPIPGSRNNAVNDLASPLGNGISVHEEHSDQIDAAHAGGDRNGSVKNDQYNDSDHEETPDTSDYREIFSNATWDLKFVPVFFQGANVINPNIIPHPFEYWQWIIIAQHEQSGKNLGTEQQLVCTAVFYQSSLLCMGAHTALPLLQPSIEGYCEGLSVDMASHLGPRSARVFYGPDAPYVMYQSKSQYGCMGVWVQDARTLLDAFRYEHFIEPQLFQKATELRRPGPTRSVEKNYFLFWDRQGQLYVHHDLFPQRVLARLNPDGSVGEDLAPFTATSDRFCFAKYMPHFALEQGDIQQASNALSITLCKRANSGCVPSDSNTFVMHIFHARSIYAGHAVSEPYVILFQHSAPFAVYGISQRPLWIHGRKSSISLYGSSTKPEKISITSMSWKLHTRKYHGYIDDVIFLGFGIEDSHPGAMDVVASDLLQDLVVC